MASGTLTLFNKISNTASVDLTIEGTFNIEDNLNDTPSNMKVKVVTSNTYREEFEVNTVAYHEDTDTWWVIKADTSTYITTGQYEHEIELVEYLEFYAYKHLPNCAFAPNTYTLEQMLDRLFDIAKLTIAVEYANFLDKDKIMPFMSFENYTVANAIKTISRAIDAIPKMYVDTTSTYEPTLYFINRVGLDTAVVNGLNTQFPTQYEKNRNSADQFTTRSVANIQNAKSSNLVISPTFGGYQQFVPNDVTFDSTNRDTARIYLPSKIDDILSINLYVPVYLRYITAGGSTTELYYGYYFDSNVFETLINNFGSLSAGEKASAISNLPNPNTFYSVGKNEDIDKTYDSSVSDNGRANLYYKKMGLENKFVYDAIDDDDIKDRTCHWIPFTNEVVMAKSFRNGLTSSLDHNPEYVLYEDVGVFKLVIETDPPINNEVAFAQFLYYPIADIKVSIDNDNDAQDEKFFNQNGKVIDALSASKLVFSHTQDSVEGTKIRNARYDDLDNVLPLGQLVREGNDLYVVTQRSLDLLLTDEHEWINAIYTLSKNRIARSENIVADSSVISYKIPDDNLVFRTQLYKDYIELSLTDVNSEDSYLNLSRALQLTSSIAGSNFDFTVLAKNEYGGTPTIVRYIKNPSVFDLHKSKLVNVNWQDNNVLGYEFSRVSGTLVQTPIVYTNASGKANNFEVLFCSTNQIKDANEIYNDTIATNALIPFDNPVDINEDFYEDVVIAEGQFLIRIQEADYDKDAYEIPVFEYMIQANDSYGVQGNVVVGEKLFSTFIEAPSGSFPIRYHYVINNTTRFTSENADRLYNLNAPSGSTDKRVTISRSGTGSRIVDLTLYSTFSSTLNTSAITNVGVYATDGSTVKFLFAINDYVAISPNTTSAIRLYINNWKI